MMLQEESIGQLVLMTLPYFIKGFALALRSIINKKQPIDVFQIAFVLA